MGPPLAPSDVAAVLLTHNSGDGVIRLLDGIRGQTVAPGLVVAVDNASSDGTAERLAKEQDILLVRLRVNVGVGAGHNRGWQEARQACPGVRAIWVLEHDCVPEPECLERLLDRLNGSLRSGLAVGVVSPTRFRPESVPGQKTPPRRRASPLTFNGPLILVDTLDRVGMLREDFFVGQEDHEFALRIGECDMIIVTEPGARIAHAWQLHHAPQSPLRAYYSRRNEAYLAIHIRHDRWAHLRVIWHAVGGVSRTLSREDRKRARVRAKIRGAIDGIRGDLGRKSYRYLER